jgi:transposase
VGLLLAHYARPHTEILTVPPIPYDRDAYRTRNLVERLWCRLKDWRRIATRYDKLATNYMAGVFLAAAITFWCN